MPSLSSPQGSTTYSQWVRRMLSQTQSKQKVLVNLFESSVPEPVDLVSQLVGASFGKETTSRYESAFAGGNPFVTARLASNYDVGEDSIVTTTGATGALSLIYRALLKPGDRVLVENPGFDLFAILAEANGFGVDRFERSGPAFTIDPEAIERAIGADTRIVVVSNLHNPSGLPADENTLRALGEIADRRDVFVIVDEVYLPYARSAAVSAAKLRISPRILSIDSLTKIYGLSSLRCGWIVGEPELMRPIRALNQEVEFSISKLSHAVAALVLDDPGVFLKRTDGIIAAARPIIETYHQRWLDDGLVEGQLPTYGCITFPRLVGIDDTRHFSEWLAKERGIIVAPGDYFGAPGHIRIGFGMDPGRLIYGLQVLTVGMMEYRAKPSLQAAARVAT